MKNCIAVWSFPGLLVSLWLAACGGGDSGGLSNSAAVTVPCVIPAATPVSERALARVGAYYFDGWAGPLSEYHFAGLVGGAYQDRQPLGGWRDDNACAVEQQLARAHNAGIDFFVFDWYFNPIVNEPGSNEDLDSAIRITHGLADRHGMQYAVLYVNAKPFIVAPADWAAAISEWVGYFTDPAYVLVNGKPLFVVIDMGSMRQTFGSSVGVVDAFDQLRAAAIAHGLPGVYIVGGFGLADGTSGQSWKFPDLSMAQTDGYDAVSSYNYPYAPTPVDGMLPFSALSDTGKWIWDQVALRSPVPFIPIAMDGWDPRPWNEREPLTNDMMWYSRSPQAVAAFIHDAIIWAETNPKFRVEPSPVAPIVLIEAWNEIGEGSYMTPTVGDGTSYGDALATMLGTPPTRLRSVLTLGESGPGAPNRTATGALTDATGMPMAAAPVTLAATLLDGPGIYQRYPLSGQAPADATQAIVGFRINSETAGPGTSDLTLYQISYVQNADGIERIANSDFSAGALGWQPFAQTQFVPSDRGAGQMVQALVTTSQHAELNSDPFAISGGSAFQAAFAARIAPSSVGSGYFVIIFLSGGAEIARQMMPFAAATLALGNATTDAAGVYRSSLASVGISHVVLEATYPGDGQHWPAFARLAR